MSRQVFVEHFHLSDGPIGERIALFLEHLVQDGVEVRTTQVCMLEDVSAVTYWHDRRVSTEDMVAGRNPFHAEEFSIESAGLTFPVDGHAAQFMEQLQKAGVDITTIKLVSRGGTVEQPDRYIVTVFYRYSERIVPNELEMSQ